jgi:ubiquinone/menaquinone biosynthesis C-methylase UbiE
MVNRIVQAGHKILSLPICYDLFQSAVGSVRFRSDFVKRNIQSSNFESVLDLGCGTASTIKLLPKNVKYIGVDTSQDYLDKAKNRSGELNTNFINADISDIAWAEESKVIGNSLTIALGIFHHIDDHQFNKVLGNLNLVLPIGGKTTRMASWFARNDRGQYLRSADYYQDKFREFGFEMKYEITRNDFRIPYDLILMSAKKIG